MLSHLLSCVMNIWHWLDFLCLSLKCFLRQFLCIASTTRRYLSEHRQFLQKRINNEHSKKPNRMGCQSRTSNQMLLNTDTLAWLDCFSINIFHLNGLAVVVFCQWLFASVRVLCAPIKFHWLNHKELDIAYACLHYVCSRNYRHRITVHIEMSMYN